MIAKIAVDKAAFGFDRLFDYEVPPFLEAKAKPGCRVLISFGTSAQKRQGMIFAVGERADGTVKLKPITSVLDEEPVLDGELMELAQFLSERTFCPLFEAVKAMLPPGLNYKPTYRYFVVSDG